MTSDEQQCLDRLRSEATSEAEDDNAYWSAVEAVREIPVGLIEALRSWSEHPDPRLRETVPDVLRAVPIAPSRRTSHADPRALPRDARARVGCPRHLRPRHGQRRPQFRRARKAHGPLLRAHERAGPVRCRPGAPLRPKRRGLRRVARAVRRSGSRYAELGNVGLANLRREEGDGYLDSVALRSALWARRDDAIAEIRAEATLGLAQRQDPRAVQMAARGLAERPDVWDQHVEAALLLRAPELYGSLLKLKSDGWHSNLLEGALAACHQVVR